MKEEPLQEITEYLMRTSRKLGGVGKAVCVDETFFTKKKRSEGGFSGSTTLGHQTMVMAALNSHPRETIARTLEGVYLPALQEGRLTPGRFFSVVWY